MIRFRGHPIEDDAELGPWGVGLTMTQCGAIVAIRCGVGRAKALRNALVKHANGDKIYCGRWEKCTYRVVVSDVSFGPPKRWCVETDKRKGKAREAQARARRILALMFRDQ